MEIVIFVMISLQMFYRDWEKFPLFGLWRYGYSWPNAAIRWRMRRKSTNHPFRWVIFTWGMHGLRMVIRTPNGCKRQIPEFAYGNWRRSIYMREHTSHINNKLSQCINVTHQSKLARTGTPLTKQQSQRKYLTGKRNSGQKFLTQGPMNTSFAVHGLLPGSQTW